MFWIGLGVGTFVGGCIGIFIAALCAISQDGSKP